MLHAILNSYKSP